MMLSETVVKAMAVGKVFKEGEAVTSMDFFPSGKYLVTASEDNSVRLYDAVTGVRKTVLNAFKVRGARGVFLSVCFLTLPQYGVDVVRFTHHDYAVLCASNNGWDHTLRYWSLHDNSYLRYFKGTLLFACVVFSYLLSTQCVSHSPFLSFFFPSVFSPGSHGQG
jgi:COMPASS component SWD2